MLRILTSLKLTVVFLALALALVFVGTIAQVDQGLYQAQARYFKSFFVYWSPANGGLKIPVFPGGYLIGAVLLANLIAMQFQRGGFIRENVGLLMVHAGLVLLLAGQLLTDLLSVESAMRLVRGQTAYYAEDFHQSELAIVDKSNPKGDVEVAIPETVLARKGEISHPRLPVRIKVRDYWPNAELSGTGTNGFMSVSVTQGVGRGGVFVRPEAPGASTDLRNTPAAVVELTGPAGSLGSWIIWSQLAPRQPFQVDGREFELSLRVRRYYKPFSITLLDLRHDVYPGTDIPKNFSSRVRLQNPQTGEDREDVIKMNSPLRYKGETYYQYQMEKASDVSVLQVVRNPGWLTPYFSCVLVGLGLTIHFVIHLVGFLKRRAA